MKQNATKLREIFIRDTKKTNWRQPLAMFVAALAVLSAPASIYAAYIFFERMAGGISALKEDGEKLRAALGQLGDFYGGVLNPIFGLITIVLVFITLLLQRAELNAAKKELELQRSQTEKQNKSINVQGFEQTFFSWLNSYRDIINNVEYGSRSGARALHVMFNSVGGEGAISQYFGDKNLSEFKVVWESKSRLQVLICSPI